MADGVTRYDVLDRLRIIDTPPEDDFDNLAVVARAVCKTPIALVSLVHRDRQWFKARIGFDRAETPLNQSVCLHALASEDLLIIPDLSQDDRTSGNTLVTEGPQIRFYAGAPLRMDGVAFGSICVIDTAPRPEGLTEDQAQALKALAGQVVSQIEARYRRRLWADEVEAQNTLMGSAADQAMALVRLGDKLQALSTEEEVVEAGSAMMAETLGATRAGFGIVDPERETVMMQPEWRAPGVRSLAGLHNFRTYGTFIDDLKRGELVLITDVETDPRTQARARELLSVGIRVLINVPVFQYGRLVLVGFVHYDWPRPLGERDVTFIRTVADRIQSAIAQLRAEEERQLLNRELSHRLKNTFAMITAIARQTFGGLDRDALRSFSARLTAVGAAYDLLAHERWQATDLDAVVAASLTVAGGEGRLNRKGPHVLLGPEAAMSASLLLHELTTNAMKYGALSVPEGIVDVTWSREGEEIVLTWQESKGPPVAPPVRTGFGSRLVRMGLGGNGVSQVDFAPTGLCVQVRAPAAHLAR